MHNKTNELYCQRERAKLYIVKKKKIQHSVAGIQIGAKKHLVICKTSSKVGYVL